MCGRRSAVWGPEIEPPGRWISIPFAAGIEADKLSSEIDPVSDGRRFVSALMLVGESQFAVARTDDRASLYHPSLAGAEMDGCAVPRATCAGKTADGDC